MPRREALVRDQEVRQHLQRLGVEAVVGLDRANRQGDLLELCGREWWAGGPAVLQGDDLLRVLRTVEPTTSLQGNLYALWAAVAGCPQPARLPDDL